MLERFDGLQCYGLEKAKPFVTFDSSCFFSWLSLLSGSRLWWLLVSVAVAVWLRFRFFYVEVLLKVTVDVIVAVNVSKKMLVLFKVGDSHSWTPTLINYLIFVVGDGCGRCHDPGRFKRDLSTFVQDEVVATEEGAEGCRQACCADGKCEASFCYLGSGIWLTLLAMMFQQPANTW